MLGALRKRLAKQGGYALSQFSTSSSPQFKAMIMLKRKEGCIESCDNTRNLAMLPNSLPNIKVSSDPSSRNGG
eukprot:2617146-Prorocentrum_lima.AAC.1